jgi:hypothetical protein
MKKQTVMIAGLMLLSFSAFASIESQAAYSDAPVDGGLSFLLIAGVAGYGAKKMKERRQRINDANNINRK